MSPILLSVKLFRIDNECFCTVSAGSTYTSYYIAYNKFQTRALFRLTESFDFKNDYITVFKDIAYYNNTICIIEDNLTNIILCYYSIGNCSRVLSL